MSPKGGEPHKGNHRENGNGVGGIPHMVCGMDGW